MPYVERVTSPKKQRLIQAFKYQTDGGTFQGNIHRGKDYWGIPGKRSSRGPQKVLMTQGLSVPKLHGRHNKEQKGSPYTNIQWGNSIQQHGIIPQKMKLERISHPNYINFIRIKFRQNIPKLTWQLRRGRRESKTGPDVPCYGRLHMNESQALHKPRTGKDHGKVTQELPVVQGAGKARRARRAGALSQSWTSAGCCLLGVCLGRGLPCQGEGTEKGREIWDHLRALMRKGRGNGKPRQKGIAGVGGTQGWGQVGLPCGWGGWWGGRKVLAGSCLVGMLY